MSRLLMSTNTLFTPTSLPYPFSFFFFIAPPTTEIYTLSLHDALPISSWQTARNSAWRRTSSAATSAVSGAWRKPWSTAWSADRKSTRLNSSHGSISYAVFCLKKKNKQHKHGHADYEQGRSPRRLLRQA